MVVACTFKQDEGRWKSRRGVSGSALDNKL
jgi:hypothetical protein